jgi:signal transduction histidine kinase
VPDARTTDVFSVDTQLFRELGELLVGRDSTALTELVKNAYDADATYVRVTGHNLDDPAVGTISVLDDGTGMSAAQFRKGYLTIAGRSKNRGERRSTVFGRRFTGEKGIGRLATHKLAHNLGISSVAGTIDHARGRSQVTARIDWDAVERYPTVADIGRDALTVAHKTLPRPRASGTAVLLENLRHGWTERDLAEFVIELDAFQPPALLAERLPRDLLPTPLLFRSALTRDASDSEEFRLDLDGDFERSQDFWGEVANLASWVIEIDSSPSRIRIAIARVNGKGDVKHDPPELRVEIPPLDPLQPTFTARILARENARGTRRTRDFVSLASGVRVFMEGFRVAPYGEQGNDWLTLDRQYARRNPRLNLDLPSLPVAAVRNEGLRGLPNNAYVGAVFLTHAGVPGLEMLVNREGFVPSPKFDLVTRTVRTSIDLLTRMRASYGVAEGSRNVSREAGVVLLSAEHRIRDGLIEASGQARELRTAVAGSGLGDIDDRAAELALGLEALSELATQAIADRSLLRIVAAVGTQMAAFVHETQGLVGAAQSVMRALELLADAHPDQRGDLASIRQSVQDVAQRIDNQASYLSEVTTVSVRRRRQRLKVADRLESAVSLVGAAAARQRITLSQTIEDNLRTVPMYPAELTVILSNLLTNAVKAAGEDGRVDVIGTRDSVGLQIIIRNTGAAVDAADGEQWFRPFASTTVETIDPLLGQGMGLGLPITRSIVEDYKGTVRFVKPPRRWATAVELRLP